MSAHTPGPWQYVRLVPDDHGIVTRAGTYEVRTPTSDIAANVPGGGPITHEADARLIAAAPMMYDFIAKLAASGDQEAIRILRQGMEPDTRQEDTPA